MKGATRRATFVVAIGGMALMLAGIDGYVRADHGVVEKSDRLRQEITVACTEAVVSDAESSCDTIAGGKAFAKPGVTYVTKAFQSGDTETTLVKTRIEK
ncbi:hypothetical protein [Breoghania sp. L-A4]|uniref:hypothetical protein n=1 Tax=Breoghania sp. L-A4 TaxID=2304600 RepID=UPI000E35A0F5|nr:hypothetical protein [Breoghania sp. L-A4]AXS40559.1 hypothetical protein D1F64_11435 [Breoghania sp. L-A4]